ncbi:MAG: hypothetical protein AAGM84_17970 [Pseudomonadota bacterium]
MREIGFVRDDKVSGVEKLPLIVIAGFGGAGLILLRYLAENAVLAFYLEVSSGHVYPGCALKPGMDTATFFYECHRVLLRNYIRVGAIITLVVGVTGLWWFVAEAVRLRKERKAAEEKREVSK